MRALNLIIGESWPTDRSFDESDFHGRDTTKPIQIDIYFDLPWEETRNRKPLKVAGFRLRCKPYERATKSKEVGDLKVDYLCIGPAGGELSYPSVPGDFRSAPLPLRVSDDMRRRTPLLYVDVMREYGRQAPSSRWSILRKIVEHVFSGFASDRGLSRFVDQDGTEHSLTRAEAFERSIALAYSFLRTQDFQRLESRLAANALEQMGLDPGKDGVTLGFSLHDPANAYKNLELLIQQMNVVSPAEDVGAGLQSAIVVAIFRTYEEMRKDGAIFAIEEPEAFLHPQKARYFAEVLERIADSGNQVFLTTHSPFFVKLHRPESVVVVRRTEQLGTTSVQTSAVQVTPTLKAALKVQTTISAAKAEMMFAKAVLLVEGITESMAMPFVFSALGIDQNRESITVVDCGGKPGIPFYVSIASAFGIPFVVLCDLDDPNHPDQRKQTSAIRAICPTDRLFLMSPDFERECGYAATDKLVDAHRHFNAEPPPTVPKVIREAVERLLLP